MTIRITAQYLDRLDDSGLLEAYKRCKRAYDLAAAYASYTVMTSEAKRLDRIRAAAKRRGCTIIDR